MLLFVVNSAYSWNFELGCWTNDKPELGATVTIYNEDGSYKASIDETSSEHIDQLIITEGEQIKIDFGLTTDEDNNIQQERIFWNNEIRNDWSINIQDNTATTTTLSTSSASSSKFDFYNYLTGGLESKPQYFQENSDLIAYNDGNPQFDYVKTFMPEAGNYELLLRVSDSCGDDGTDEDYVFIPVIVNPKEVEQNITGTYTCNYVSTPSVAQAGIYVYSPNTYSLTSIITPKSNITLYSMTKYTGTSGSFSQSTHFEIQRMDDNNGTITYVPIYNQSYTHTKTVVLTTPLELEANQKYRVLSYASSFVNSNLGGIYESSQILFNASATGFHDFVQFTTYTDLQCEYQSNVYTCDGYLYVPSNAISPTDITINPTCTDIYFAGGGTTNFYANGTNTNIVNLLGSTSTHYFNVMNDNMKFNQDVAGAFRWDLKNKNNIELYTRNSQYTVGISDTSKISKGLAGSTSYVAIGSNNQGILENVVATGDTYLSTETTINNNLDLNFETGTTSYMNLFTGSDNTFNFIGDKSEQSIYLTYTPIYGPEKLIGNEFLGITNIEFFYEFWQNHSMDVGLNTFKFRSDELAGFDDGMFMGASVDEYYIYADYDDVKVGNRYLDENGDNIFTCPTTTTMVTYNGENYYVCDQPVKIFTTPMYDIDMYDYIIVDKDEYTDINKNPKAVLNIDNNEVEVGTTVCWDTTESYDPDGTITSKQVYVDNIKSSVIDSNCFTKSSPTITTIRLVVTDNYGDSDIEEKYVAFKNENATCDLNDAPTVVISYQQGDNNLYYLNMTTNDLNNDTLEYAWSVNGEIITGQNIYTSVDYNQFVYASVYDGCVMGGDYVWIDVGQNETTETDSIEVNLVCSPQSIFSPSTVNCEVVYDLKGNNLMDIIWLSDNTHYEENDGASIFSRVYGDEDEHIITVAVQSSDGQYKSDYYRFNLIEGSDGGGSGGGDTTPDEEKDICNIDITPNILNIDDENTIVSFTIENNDVVSWSPDYKFENINGYDSASNDLSITNEIGTIQPEDTKEVGVAYDISLFSTDSILAKNTMIFTSDNCEDISIVINTNISNEAKLEYFTTDELLSSYLSKDALEMSILSDELIGDNELLGSFKIWHLVIIITLLFTLILWKWKPAKPNVKSNKIIQNLIIKSLVIGLITMFVSIVLVYLIRWVVEII